MGFVNDGLSTTSWFSAVGRVDTHVTIYFASIVGVQSVVVEFAQSATSAAAELQYSMDSHGQSSWILLAQFADDCQARFGSK